MKNPDSSVSRLRRALAGALCIGAAIPSAVFAQGGTVASYPSRPITLVVPFAAGGATDVLSRLLGEQLARQLGQPVVIRNVGGAGGQIGAMEVFRAAPDGHTLLMGSNSIFSLQPALSGKTPYNGDEGFEVVAKVVSGSQALVVRKDSPIKNVGQLVRMARTPKGLTFGTGGNGSVSHVASLVMFAKAGVTPLHVPYKSNSLAIVGLLGGDIDFLFDNLSSVIPRVKDGSVRALALTSKSPVPQLPGVEPLAKQGFPGYETLYWNGLYAPKGTPGPIVQRLEAEIAKALQVRGLVSKLQDAAGVEADFAPGPALKRQTEGEVAQWKALFTTNKITPE